MIAISDDLEVSNEWWRYQTVWRITIHGGDI
jgi:hypothetical protein